MMHAGPLWRVRLYTAPDGRQPVGEFLAGLRTENYRGWYHFMHVVAELLREFGPNLEGHCAVTRHPGLVALRWHGDGLRPPSWRVYAGVADATRSIFLLHGLREPLGAALRGFGQAERVSVARFEDTFSEDYDGRH